MCVWGGGGGSGRRGQWSRCKQDVVKGDSGADGHHGRPGVKLGWVDDDDEVMLNVLRCQLTY